MKFKGTTQNHEDVKFSYVVLRKSKRPIPSFEKDKDGILVDVDLGKASFGWPRLVGAPMKRDKHVILDLCAPSGIL